MENIKVNEKIKNKKYKLNKKFKTALLVTALSMSIVGCGDKEEDKGNIINIGNHVKFSSILDEGKIMFTHFRNQDLGLIVTPTKLSEAGTYNDVKVVKEYLTKYDVTLPVYLNIEAMINDRNMNLTGKKEQIHAFLENCKKNNISVGVYGTDSLLTQNYEALGLQEYGAYVIKETDAVTYPGNIQVTKELSGDLTIREDLSSVIKEKNKNNDEKFVSDYIHTIAPGETIDTVALKYNLSANGILSYNGISARKAKEGVSLEIPNQVAEGETTVTEEKKTKFNKRLFWSLKEELAVLAGGLIFTTTVAAARRKRKKENSVEGITKY